MAKKAKAARKQGIPDDVKAHVNEIVETFNKSEPAAKKCPYVTRFRGNYLYLDRSEARASSPICRLKYTGKLDDWGFAIYKYSRDAYDADEWFFPGSQHVNGTIEGAMRAGLEAYPPRQRVGCLQRGRGCLLMLSPAWLLGHLTIWLMRKKMEQDIRAYIEDEQL
ncbi:MAG: hypothetical protein JXB30_06745 [Anaerolineae bacterium]|nr:hypothetical protein [Anaerolineae bacterium]